MKMKEFAIALTTQSARGYLLDFILMPIMVVVLMRHRNLLIAPLLAGVIAWTYLEYAIHRYAFHGIRFFAAAHREHHLRPVGWAGASSAITAPGFLALLGVVSALAGLDMASQFVSGVIIGYLTYLTIHVMLHHCEPESFGPYLSFLVRHHDSHHAGANANFGVSSPIWDFILRTYRF